MLKRLGKVKQAPSNNDIVVQGHKEAYLVKRKKKKNKQPKSYIYEVNKKIPDEFLHISVKQSMNLCLIQLNQKKKGTTCSIKVPENFLNFQFSPYLTCYTYTFTGIFPADYSVPQFLISRESKIQVDWLNRHIYTNSFNGSIQVLRSSKTL